jgi:hypothetical protein
MLRGFVEALEKLDKDSPEAVCFYLFFFFICRLPFSFSLLLFYFYAVNSLKLYVQAFIVRSLKPLLFQPLQDVRFFNLI